MRSRECWVEIEDFPRYLVSTHGRVKNQVTGHILRQSPRRGHGNHKGYLRVNLCTDYGCFTKSVHKLVALAFIGNIPYGFEPNHIDGNTFNNCVWNLEIITHSKNMLHAYSTGLKIPSGGKKKIPVRNVETREIFTSITDAARSVNAFKTQISQSLYRPNSTVKGFHFERVD